MARLTKKQFDKYLDRDKHCWHCGATDDTLVPHHRINRGMGGSKLLDTPANVIVMCSAINLGMEMDPALAEAAKSYGWKLASWEDPEKRYVLDLSKGLWFRLDNSYGRIATRKDPNADC